LPFKHNNITEKNIFSIILKSNVYHINQEHRLKINFTAIYIYRIPLSVLFSINQNIQTEDELYVYEASLITVE